ncbi:MAG: response regulator transcription factor [Eubacteriaceae bacterium]|nr:response regulator transcription factor [Eubacteriaceae bacterium]
MLECLIIDDDINIAETICEYFSLFDLSCEYAVDYEAGLKAIAEKKPAVILLDVNLGNQTGFELCKKVRETSEVPIIFISARNTVDDALAAFGIGGDDYITKPFSMAVLLAKTKAVLKRNTLSQSQKLQPAISFGDVEVDMNLERVMRAGEPVKLKPLELRLLLYLIENQGKPITKDELLEKVWGDTFIGDGTLSVHIRHLREKLEALPNEPRFIKTIWGSGYMFEC